MNPERAVALLKEADPASDLDAVQLPHATGAAYLAALEQGSRKMKMKTQEAVRQLPDIHDAPAASGPRWRGPLIAAAAAVLVLLVVGAGLWLVADGSRQAPVVDEPAPGTLVPEISSDLSNIGEVLTAAHNADDPEVLLSLFAEDGELRFGTWAITPAELRTVGPLTGPASNYQYDRLWARIFNDRYDYTSCEINADRATCDMIITTDYLNPLMDHFPATTAIQVRDGEIVLLRVAGVYGPDNAIMADFQDWTQENYPEEAELMWVNDWEADEVSTEESALLHLRLGQEYVESQP